MRGTSRTLGLGTLMGWHAVARQRTGEGSASHISQRMPAARSESGLPYVPPVPSDATITDGRYFGEAIGGPGGSGGRDGAPVWPGVRGGGHNTSPSGQIPLVAFLTGGGLVALVVIIILANAITGDLLAISNAGTPGANGVVAHGTATATPRATVTPKPSPTPRIVLTHWLSVSKHEITFPCKGNNRTQTFTLTNNGPQDVGWHAEIQTNFGRPLVSVNPNNDTLESHDSQKITVTYTRGIFPFPQSGTITFVPDNNDAGDPQSVSYSIQSCG
jgi:hypothetical protein